MIKMIRNVLACLLISSQVFAQFVVAPVNFTFNEDGWQLGAFSGSAVIDASNGFHGCCKALTVIGNGSQPSAGFGFLQLSTQLERGATYIVTAYVKADDAVEGTPLLIAIASVDENGTDLTQALFLYKSSVPSSGWQPVSIGTITVPLDAQNDIYLVAGEFNGIFGTYADGKWSIDDIKFKKISIIIEDSGEVQ